MDDLLTQEPLAGDTVPGKTSAYKLTLMIVGYTENEKENALMQNHPPRGFATSSLNRMNSLLLIRVSFEPDGR